MSASDPRRGCGVATVDRAWAASRLSPTTEMNGEAWSDALPRSAGVLVLGGEADRERGLVVLATASVRALARRRAESKEGEVYRWARWLSCGSFTEAELVQLAVARAAADEDTARAIVGRATSWALRINPDRAFARFAVINAAEALRRLDAGHPSAIIGPIVSKRAAGELVRQLETVFELSGDLALLEKQGDAAPDAAQARAYRDRVQHAAGFAAGERSIDEIAGGFERQMADAADDQDFERAARLRDRLESARAIANAAPPPLAKLGSACFIAPLANPAAENVTRAAVMHRSRFAIAEWSDDESAASVAGAIGGWLDAEPLQDVSVASQDERLQGFVWWCRLVSRGRLDRVLASTRGSVAPAIEAVQREASAPRGDAGD